MSKTMVYEYQPMDEVFFFKAKKMYDYYATPKKYADQIYDNYHQEFPKNEKLNVLDVGCGLGALSDRWYNAGHNLTMIELNDDLIPILQEKYPNAKIIHGDFLKMTYSFDIGGPFDVVLCNPPFGSKVGGIKDEHIHFLMKILKGKTDIHNKTVVYFIGPGGMITNFNNKGDKLEPEEDLKLSKALIKRLKENELWKTKDKLFDEKINFVYLDDVEDFQTTKMKCKLFRID